MDRSKIALVGETHPDWIVVEDPRGKWAEGSLVKLDRARELDGKGVVLLPVVPELFRLSGVGGFFKRSWGTGYPLSGTVPMYSCPVSISIDPMMIRAGIPGGGPTGCWVHWRAHVVVREGTEPQGMLRMAADSGQAHSKHAPIVAGTSQAIDLAQLEGPDGRGGWTLGGKVQVTPSVPGIYGFGFYGQAKSLAVRWLAASATF